MRRLATPPREGRRGQRQPGRFKDFEICRVSVLDLENGFLNCEIVCLNLEIVFLNLEVCLLNLEFLFLNLESDLLTRVFDLLNFGGRGFRPRHLQIWVVY